jgi:hypothetical protein
MKDFFNCPVNKIHIMIFHKLRSIVILGRGFISIFIICIKVYIIYIMGHNKECVSAGMNKKNRQSSS